MLRPVQPRHPFLESARKAAPSLRSLRASHDRDKRLAPEALELLRGEALLGALVPRELGGSELSPPVYLELLAELARGDAATAWCLMTASTSTLLAAYLPRASAQELWRGALPLVAGVFAPSGEVQELDGGLRLRGRWAYASGCRHAELFALGALRGGRHVVAFVPAREVKLIETWDPLGLAGTGSHDVEVDALVLERHLATLVGGSPWTTAPLYRVPVFGLLAAGVSACGLGIAAAALEAVAQRLGENASTAQLARYGELHAEHSASRAYLLASASAAAQLAEEREPKAAQLASARGELRLAATHVARRCAELTRAAFQLGGGASARASSPLAAALRDIETLLTHRMVSERVLPAAARAVLGIGALSPEL